MKRLLLTTIIFMGACAVSNAQSIISEESMTSDGKNVTVSFVVDTDADGVASNRKEVLMPFIYNTTDTLWLDPIMVYGKGRYRRERQEMHIQGDKDWELGENQVMKGEGKIVYNDIAPLKIWMTSAKLGIRRHIIGCARCNEGLQDRIIASEELFRMPELPARRTPVYVLKDAERFWDFGQDELEIVFKVSKIELDPTVFNNEVTFGRILEAVDKIFSDPQYRLDKIQVAGYASPEGPPQFNKWLGENRAKTLINYIISERPEYNLTMDDFEIVNGEENWVGLRKIIVDSELEMKNEVIAIIDDEEIPNERKKLRIEALDLGWTWKRMLQEIYPHLRSARYLSIYYDSTDDRAVDTINEANQLIREGKYEEALNHIKPVENDMRAFNTIGVALMMQLKFDEAMPWFEKALEGNCPSAQSNIDAINAEYEYERQQRVELEEYLNQYR